MLGTILLVVLILMLWVRCPPGATAEIGATVPAAAWDWWLIVFLVLVLLGRI